MSATLCSTDAVQLSLAHCFLWVIDVHKSPDDFSPCLTGNSDSAVPDVNNHHFTLSAFVILYKRHSVLVRRNHSAWIVAAGAVGIANRKRTTKAFLPFFAPALSSPCC